jgi:hypothetical protein
MCRNCTTDRIKRYRNTDKGRENIYRALKKSTAKFRYKQDAREILNWHLKKNKIEKSNCFCGKKGEAHHPDYSKPLEVIWLCRPHHSELHRQLKKTLV